MQKGKSNTPHASSEEEAKNFAGRKQCFAGHYL
jgi:hypothetical protein